MFNLNKKKSFRYLKNIVHGVFLGVCCNAFAANALVPALMEQGMKLYSEKNYKAASDYLGQVVDMEPEHSQARYYLIYSLALSGNNEQALKHAEILAKKFPKEKQYKTLVNQIKNQIGATLTSNSNNSSNQTKYDNVKKEVVFGGYQSLDKNAEMRSPNVDYTPRDIKPARPLTPIEKAVKMIDEEDYASAEKLLKEILKKEPKNADAFHNLGVVEMGRNNFRNAIEYFERASKIKSNNFQTFYLLGDCYKKLGDLKNAEKAFNSASVIKYDEFALTNLADIKLELGDLAKSENIYNQILKKSPNFSDAKVGIAKIRFEQGKVDEAMALANEALKNGNVGEANYVRAQALIANKLYSEAVEDLLPALTVSPDNPKYLMTRAKANMGLINYSVAIDDITTILNANPNYLPATFMLGEAYVRGAAEDETEKLLEEFETKKLDKYGEYYKIRGLLSKRRENDEAAKNDFLKYAEIYINKPAIQLECGELLETIESAKDDALKQYKNIVQKFPNTLYAVKANEAITRINSQSDDSGSINDVGINNNMNSDFSSSLSNPSLSDSDSTDDFGDMGLESSLDDGFGENLRPGNEKF